jgi:Domain of unknown function (DUF4190)/DnaJ domain
VSRPSFGELGGQDPYDILELPSGASEAEVRAARKRLLRRYHPDLPTGDLRRTQMITAAADLLLDPLRRIGYYDLRDDESRRTVFSTAQPTDVWSTRAGPARVDEPAAPQAEPREAAPASGARTDGHWFRPLGGNDGRGPRPQTAAGSSAFRPANGFGASGTATNGMGASGATTNGMGASGATTNGTGGNGATPNGTAPHDAASSAATSGAAGPGTAGYGGTARGAAGNGTSPPAGARPASPGDFGGGRRRGLRRRRAVPAGGRWATRTGHREDGAAEPRPGSGGLSGSSAPPPAAPPPAASTRAAADGRGPGIRPTFITPPSQSEKPPPEPAARHAVTDQPIAASRWNALAIASVVAILTWTPLPLILGMLALGQIRRYGQRGTRLAITGVIAGAILLVGYFYILVVSR